MSGRRSQGHWGPRCEKLLAFDTGSFRRTRDCSRQCTLIASLVACPRGCSTPSTGLPRAPGLLQVGDSKPLFTASVRSPHRRPPSEPAKIRHYSQLPVPTRVQTGSLVFPLVSTTAFISLFLSGLWALLWSGFLGVKVWGVSGLGGPAADALARASSPGKAWDKNDVAHLWLCQQREHLARHMVGLLYMFVQRI